jgi:hypothetical protein
MELKSLGHYKACIFSLVTSAVAKVPKLPSQDCIPSMHITLPHNLISLHLISHSCYLLGLVEVMQNPFNL